MPTNLDTFDGTLGGLGRLQMRQLGGRREQLAKSLGLLLLLDGEFVKEAGAVLTLTLSARMTSPSSASSGAEEEFGEVVGLGRRRL